MKFLQMWEERRFIKRANRVVKVCVRYCEEAERISRRIPGCKKFRGISMINEDQTISIDIKVVDKEEGEE